MVILLIFVNFRGFCDSGISGDSGESCEFGDSGDSCKYGKTGVTGESDDSTELADSD